MKTSYEMDKKLSNTLINMIDQENLPINITLGKTYQHDPNDPAAYQQDVTIEFDDSYSEQFDSVMAVCISRTFNL